MAKNCFVIINFDYKWDIWMIKADFRFSKSDRTKCNKLYFRGLKPKMDVGRGAERKVRKAFVVNNRGVRMDSKVFEWIDLSRRIVEFVSG